MVIQDFGVFWELLDIKISRNYVFKRDNDFLFLNEFNLFSWGLQDL